MNRLLLLLAALIGGAVFAWVATTLVAAVAFGALWIFVYGDDPWPGWVGKVAEPLIFLLAIFLWVAAGRRTWRKLSRRG